MEPMYFNWQKCVPTENHFPHILEEILNCDHQRCDLEQGECQSLPAGSSELNANFRHSHIDGEHLQRQPYPDFPQLRTRGKSHCHGSFCCSTPEMSYNCHHSGQITSLPYEAAHSFMPHKPSIRPTNHHGFDDRRALQLEQLTDHNFNYDDQHQEVLNSKLAFNHQVTSPID